MGEHNITVRSEHGVAEATFTVKAAAGGSTETGGGAGTDGAAGTGDHSDITLWLVLAAAALCGLCGMTVYGRKRRNAK